MINIEFLFTSLFPPPSHTLMPSSSMVFSIFICDASICSTTQAKSRKPNLPACLHSLPHSHINKFCCPTMPYPKSAQLSLLSMLCTPLPELLKMLWNLFSTLCPTHQKSLLYSPDGVVFLKYKGVRSESSFAPTRFWLLFLLTYRKSQLLS